MPEIKLKPCPFCGGEIDIHGAQCNYGKNVMTLFLECLKCGTSYKFKSTFANAPYPEAVEAWNRRVTDGKT